MTAKQEPTPTKNILSDEDILNLYFARSEDAIRATDDKYGSYLIAIAYNIIHSHDISEECLNDTYFSTWNVVPPERPSAFRVFLSRIMRNRAIDRYEEKEKLFGEENFREVERAVLLRNVDTAWMEHIDTMEDLKSNVGLQAYAQRDPVTEYRIQGADLFDTMVDDIRQNTVRTILSIVPRVQPIQRVQVAKPLGEGPAGPRRVTVKSRASGTVVKDGGQVGRNDPCPCGSGKKYKNCCMRQGANG